MRPLFSQGSAGHRSSFQPLGGKSSGTHFQYMKAELVDKAALVITDPPILINLVSKRVRQLNQGRPALVERKPGMREADIALQEIIEGKISVERLEDLPEE